MIINDKKKKDLTLNCGAGECSIECQDGTNTCRSAAVNILPTTAAFKCIRPGLNNLECNRIDQDIMPFTRTTLSPTLATRFPTSSPSYSPTPSPSLDPTFPSYNPTPSPSNNPTNNPIPSPSTHPTPSPSNNPTKNPIPSPSKDPTPSPTFKPTFTRSPSQTPTEITSNPTPSPITIPQPTLSPIPTPLPTSSPLPTAYPSQTPSTMKPTKPTRKPTINYYVVGGVTQTTKDNINIYSNDDVKVGDMASILFDNWLYTVIAGGIAMCCFVTGNMYNNDND